jgi:hypothetical protein
LKIAGDLFKQRNLAETDEQAIKNTLDEISWPCAMLLFGNISFFVLAGSTASRTPAQREAKLLLLASGAMTRKLLGGKFSY